MNLVTVIECLIDECFLANCSCVEPEAAMTKILCSRVNVLLSFSGESL